MREPPLSQYYDALYSLNRLIGVLEDGEELPTAIDAVRQNRDNIWQMIVRLDPTAKD